MSNKRFIQPTGLSKPVGYTHTVSVERGRMVFIAGQVAFDANNNVVSAGDLRAQTEQVFKNLGIALAAAGASYADVVKWTIYVVNFKPPRSRCCRAAGPHQRHRQRQARDHCRYRLAARKVLRCFAPDLDGHASGV